MMVGDLGLAPFTLLPILGIQILLSEKHTLTPPFVGGRMDQCISQSCMKMGFRNDDAFGNRGFGRAGRYRYSLRTLHGRIRLSLRDFQSIALEQDWRKQRERWSSISSL